MNDLAKLALESLATGSTSMTLARSRMFREVRWWFHRHGGEWAWDLAKCPWCVSHWVAMVVVILAGDPVAATSNWWLDLMLNWMTIVALAPFPALLIHRIYGNLPPVPTEAEWAAGEPSEEVHQ